MKPKHEIIASVDSLAALISGIKTARDPNQLRDELAGFLAEKISKEVRTRMSTYSVEELDMALCYLDRGDDGSDEDIETDAQAGEKSS